MPVVLCRRIALNRKQNRTIQSTSIGICSLDTVGWLAHLFLLGREYTKILSASRLALLLFSYFLACSPLAFATCSCLGIIAFLVYPGMRSADVATCSCLGREHAYRATHREKCCSLDTANQPAVYDAK